MCQQVRKSYSVTLHNPSILYITCSNRLGKSFFLKESLRENLLPYDVLCLAKRQVSVLFIVFFFVSALS